MCDVRQSDSNRRLPTYREEAALLSRGYSLVAGLDEAGRGPLAGPVLAGVAILPPNPRGEWTKLVRDSKQMTPAQRENAYQHLQEACVALEVGICGPEEIDALGIVPATRLAMKRALDSLALLPQYLLLDAITLPRVPVAQKSIIRGDASCLSIAAASIVAKVTRDRIMRDADLAYPGYGFASHKGYGTREHLDNIERLGPCPIHRFSFAPIKRWTRPA